MEVGDRTLRLDYLYSTCGSIEVRGVVEIGLFEVLVMVDIPEVLQRHFLLPEEPMETRHVIHVGVGLDVPKDRAPVEMLFVVVERVNQKRLVIVLPRPRTLQQPAVLKVQSGHVVALSKGYDIALRQALRVVDVDHHEPAGGKTMKVQSP
jgi:hypothetical protein